MKSPVRRALHGARIAILAGLPAFAVVACGDDVVAPPPPVEGTVTVDASKGYVYFSFADGEVVTPTPSAAASGAWDIAFSATTVTLNGGAAGPGGVSGFCICQNAGATDTQVLAMTPDSELADFDAVTAVPTATFTTDALTPAITGWFTGSGAAAQADPSRTFLVRLADSVGYAKVHVTALQNPTATSPGVVTIEYAVQATATAAPGAARTMQVDLTTGPKAIDLEAGTVTTSATDWDLRFEGFTIRVNSGVSGPGKAAAAIGAGTFESITTAKEADQAYRSDSYAGVFASSRWYRYNIGGTGNRISPTFEVYLVRRGSAVYKVQLLNYYNVTGSPRHITFRYEQIAG